MAAAFVPSAAAAACGARHTSALRLASSRPAAAAVPTSAPRRHVSRMGVAGPAAAAAAAVAAAAAAAPAASPVALVPAAPSAAALAVPWAAIHALAVDIGPFTGVDIQAVGLVAAIAAGGLLAAIVAFVIIKV